MPLFYFNIKNDAEIREGDTPVLFSSLEAAKADAVRSIRELMAENPGDWPFGTLGLCFEICDEQGEVLDTVPFSSALVFH